MMKLFQVTVDNICCVFENRYEAGYFLGNKCVLDSVLSDVSVEDLNRLSRDWIMLKFSPVAFNMARSSGFVGSGTILQDPEESKMEGVNKINIQTLRTVFYVEEVGESPATLFAFVKNKSESDVTVEMYVCVSAFSEDLKKKIYEELG